MNKKIKNLDLIIILGVITLFALITTVLLLTRPFEVKTFAEIDTVTVQNYKTKDKNKSEYFVLVYNSLEELDERLEECAIAYAEYAREHRDAPRIYTIDYATNKELANSNNFNITSGKLATDIPQLATITTSGSISNQKKTIADICNLLEDYMSGKK